MEPSPKKFADSGLFLQSPQCLTDEENLSMIRMMEEDIQQRCLFLEVKMRREQRNQKSKLEEDLKTLENACYNLKASFDHERTQLELSAASFPAKIQAAESQQDKRVKELKNSHLKLVSRFQMKATKLRRRIAASSQKQLLAEGRLQAASKFSAELSTKKERETKLLRERLSELQHQVELKSRDISAERKRLASDLEQKSTVLNEALSASRRELDENSCLLSRPNMPELQDLQRSVTALEREVECFSSAENFARKLKSQIVDLKRSCEKEIMSSKSASLEAKKFGKRKTCEMRNRLLEQQKRFAAERNKFKVAVADVEKNLLTLASTKSCYVREKKLQRKEARKHFRSEENTLQEKRKELLVQLESAQVKVQDQVSKARAEKLLHVEKTRAEIKSRQSAHENNIRSHMITITEFEKRADNLSLQIRERNRRYLKTIQGLCGELQRLKMAEEEVKDLLSLKKAEAKSELNLIAEARTKFTDGMRQKAQSVERDFEEVTRHLHEICKRENVDTVREEIRALTEEKECLLNNADSLVAETITQGLQASVALKHLHSTSEQGKVAHAQLTASLNSLIKDARNQHEADVEMYRFRTMDKYEKMEELKSEHQYFYDTIHRLIPFASACKVSSQDLDRVQWSLRGICKDIHRNYEKLLLDTAREVERTSNEMQTIRERHWKEKNALQHKLEEFQSHRRDSGDLGKTVPTISSECDGSQSQTSSSQEKIAELDHITKRNRRLQKKLDLLDDKERKLANVTTFTINDLGQSYVSGDFCRKVHTGLRRRDYQAEEIALRQRISDISAENRHLRLGLEDMMKYSNN